MTQRLTNYLKERVTKELLAPLDAKIAAVADELSVLGKELHERLYTTKERKLMDSLPEGWLTTIDSYIIDRRYVEGYSRGMICQLQLTFRERVPYVHPTRIKVGEKPRDVDLTDFFAKIEDWETRYKAAEAVKAEATIQINAVLNSSTTVAKICEVWPEAAPTIRRVTGEPAPLPMVRMEALTELLELPEEIAA